MKLVFYDDFRFGALNGDQVVDIWSFLKALGGDSPQEVLRSVMAAFELVTPQLAPLIRASGGKKLESVRLRQPVPRPAKILCCIGNYREHTDREPRPLDMFLKAPDSIIGPGDTVVLPKREHPIFHHEAELGVVMGKTAHNVPAAEAMSYVFGYTAFVDVSARGAIGRDSSGSFIGKSYDTFGPIGPCIATVDEVPDPHALSIKLWVNGQIRHDYNTDDMEHRIPEIVEFASSITTLLPGDVIACGTNHEGLGPLQDGDVGEIEVENIGRFSFNVSDPLKRTWDAMVDEESARRVREGVPMLPPQ
jgi:2-keto-4-pentenoate hydratase/2-oxohepta-3-ene-1,7-dioic acid hydratase in catechol pathway